MIRLNKANSPMQIPDPAGKQSLMRVFLLSMAGVAVLFSLMALGIWMSVTDVLMREKRLINELLPELDVAHQLTAATADLPSQGLLLRSSLTKNELGDHQKKLGQSITGIQQTLDYSTFIKPDAVTDLRQSVVGISDIATGLTDARAEQIDSQGQVRDEVKAILGVLADIEKDVQREVFSLTGQLLSISNTMRLADNSHLDSCSGNEVFFDRVSEYDDISLAIQDYLLLDRDIVSLTAVLEKVPLLGDKNKVIQALNKHDLLVRALISRSNYINNADRTDTLLVHLSRLSARLGAKQRVFALQDVVLTQEQGQKVLYERLREQTVLILQHTSKIRNDTRAMVSQLTKETLEGLDRDRKLPVIFSLVALLLLATVSYWLLYRKTVLPLLVITRQLDDVGSDRFPKVLPEYYLKEMSALSSAMMQLDAAQKNMQVQDVQLQRINSELQSANEELQQFAHIASHDLQEPLRKLQQFSELLIEDHGQGLDTDARFYIESIRSSAKRMSTLIKETLAYSRSGSNNQKLTHVDLTQLLQQLRDEMELAVVDANGEFIIGKMPTVLANELGLAQLFRNLMINGLKYRKPDTPARIRISFDDTAVEFDGWVCIRVEDNGIGIPEKYLKKIFLPFERLHGSDVPGTGLGLAICKKVCDSHGWRLNVSSESATGTVFDIGIPESSIQ